ncbi:type II toxin-antitoxin system YoeB family toxin [Campylobacter mucosalis]|nr:type II toxin-antitoxin system YoeB family toxin [Campylobacter mucosalis]
MLLKGNLAPFWSRRIDDKNRLVYKIVGRYDTNCTMWLTLQR